jgi:hypothetical protein
MCQVVHLLKHIWYDARTQNTHEVFRMSLIKKALSAVALMGLSTAAFAGPALTFVNHLDTKIDVSTNSPIGLTVPIEKGETLPLTSTALKGACLTVSSHCKATFNRHDNGLELGWAEINASTVKLNTDADGNDLYYVNDPDHYDVILDKDGSGKLVTVTFESK